MTASIFTIGHSNHSLEHFLWLLGVHKITALADVRSSPFSRYTPHFSQDALAKSLKERGVHYVFMGRELGARSDSIRHYRDGKAQYELMAEEPRFQAGLERLRKGADSQRIALMCAEKEPLECHRTMLVGVRLRSPTLRLIHILADGAAEDHEQSELRLLEKHRLHEPDMFMSAPDRLAEAYKRQCEAIQFEDKHLNADHQGVAQ